MEAKLKDTKHGGAISPLYPSTSYVFNDIDIKQRKISYTSNNHDSKIYYDYLLFCTDPLTPSKILDDNGSCIEKKNYLGSSGKLTMFFKKPVEWKKEKALETSFRFVFSQDLQLNL